MTAARGAIAKLRWGGGYRRPKFVVAADPSLFLPALTLDPTVLANSRPRLLTGAMRKKSRGRNSGPSRDPFRRRFAPLFVE